MRGGLLILAALACASASAELNRQLPSGNHYVVDDALKRVHLADMAADEAWTACTTPDALKARQNQVRTALLRALGGFPDRTPLNGQVTGRVVRDGYAIEKVLFESRPNHHVTGHLFLPDPTKFPGKRPGVIVTCGHSVNGKGCTLYQRGALRAAKLGIITLLYDPIDQGERRQSRQSRGFYPCPAHNNIGRRAELLGWNTATFRIWDGMRTLDYLASRPEVDATKLGVMGHSGGGTMTSWIMCLDERVKSAAPSGYLSTMRSVCEALGPQDAEQFAFGELTFGFNHLGHILLRAPSPVLMCTSHDDFFPFLGSLETAKRAKQVYAVLGAKENFRLSDTLGEHAWHESTSSYAADWMCHTLLGTPLTRTMADYRALEHGFNLSKADVGLGFNIGELPDLQTNRWPASVTKTGCTLDLPGERTVYDIMADEAKRQKAARTPLTPERVRQIAGIRKLDLIGAREYNRHTRDGVTYAVLTTDDGTPIPVRTFGEGKRVLYVTDTENLHMAELEAREIAKGGCRVTLADLRGFGETAQGKHKFYGTPCWDEELAQLYALVGINLVGKRAEDILTVARHLGDKDIKLIARGRTVIPAAHAYYVGRNAFAALELRKQPASWEKLFTEDARPCQFADMVFGAWQAYDWPDLTK